MKFCQFATFVFHRFLFFNHCIHISSTIWVERGHINSSFADINNFPIHFSTMLTTVWLFVYLELGYSQLHCSCYGSLCVCDIRFCSDQHIRISFQSPCFSTSIFNVCYSLTSQIINYLLLCFEHSSSIYHTFSYVLFGSCILNL